MIKFYSVLTHWGRVTHICVGYLTIIGSDNGLSPGRRQAIIWINVGILLIGPLGINFSEILIENETFSFKKMRLKVSSAKRRPFCLCLNVLNVVRIRQHANWRPLLPCVLNMLPGMPQFSVSFSQNCTNIARAHAKFSQFEGGDNTSSW